MPGALKSPPITSKALRFFWNMACSSSMASSRLKLPLLCRYVGGNMHIHRKAVRWIALPLTKQPHPFLPAWRGTCSSTRSLRVATITPPSSRFQCLWIEPSWYLVLFRRVCRNLYLLFLPFLMTVLFQTWYYLVSRRRLAPQGLPLSPLYY